MQFHQGETANFNNAHIVLKSVLHGGSCGPTWAQSAATEGAERLILGSRDNATDQANVLFGSGVGNKFVEPAPAKSVTAISVETIDGTNFVA